MKRNYDAPNRLRSMVLTGLAAFMVWLPFGQKAFAFSEPGLVGKVIVVDAGHGGPDAGATGAFGLKEKDINLQVATRVATLLSHAGARVYMTRTTDVDLATNADRAARKRHMGDLRERLNVVKRVHPDAFISVHCNAAPSSAWRGAHCIYMTGNDEGEALAETMQESFKQLLLPTKREADPEETLYLLKRIKGPAVLAEIGFISNADEASHLRTAVYQEKVSFAMVTSIMQYFGMHEDQKKAEAVAPQAGGPDLEHPPAQEP